MRNLPLIIGFLLALMATNGCKKDPVDTDPTGLKIGDTYAGGIVFYISNTKSAGGIPVVHGKVAAVEDQTGYLGSGVDWNTAVSLCNDLRSNGYGDWVLPGKDDLKLIYNKLYVGLYNYYGLQSARYWSSDLTGDGGAWQIHFNTVYNGKEVAGSKTELGCVRAMRSF